jgi:hypothetical protein
MQMKCKCENNLFVIYHRTDCDDCEHNGWSTEDYGYKYTEPPIGIDRDMVEQEGECFYGTSYGLGCWLIKCTCCHHVEHIPAIVR